MVDQELAGTVAYCGMICGACRNTQNGCVGCRKGGGHEVCHHRSCCKNKVIDGCWQCETYPCDAGYFADEAFRGLCRGFIQTIKDKGIDEFVSLVRSRFGKRIELGELRFKTEQEILAMIDA